MSTSSSEKKSADCTIPQITQLARDKTQDALAKGREYTRKNPLAVAVGVFLAGAVVGILLSQRERKAPDPVHAAREWLYEALEDIADRLPNLKKNGAHALFEQVQDVGRKVKWW